MTSSSASLTTITHNVASGDFDLIARDSMGRIVAGTSFLTIEAAEQAVASLGRDSFTFLTR